MGAIHFADRLAALHRAFIAGRNRNQEAQRPAVDNNQKPAASRTKQKSKYIRPDTLKVKVYAYQNPEILQPVDITAPWYQDGKIVETRGYQVIVLTNGYRVKYGVQVYTFKGIPNNERKLQELFAMIRRNPKRAYTGWVHHANVYWQVSRLFRNQVPLNYFL